MKRTIKRYSLKLNTGKWLKLIEIVTAYVWQKDNFLVSYAIPATYSRYSSWRQARNELVKVNYSSPSGLQARQWKLALKDAYETIDRQYLALSVELRPFVARHQNFSAIQKRLIIPLTGQTRISGTIRVVLDYEKQRIEIHQTAEVKVKQVAGKAWPELAERAIAVDFGITEVMTDLDGKRYGTESYTPCTRKPRGKGTRPKQGV